MRKLFLVLLMPVYLSASLSAAEKISAEESAKIIDNIYKKLAPAYRKYNGFTSVRSAKVVITDSKTGELKDNIESLIKVKSNFYTYEDVLQVIKYVKNGKEQPASKFSERKSAPYYIVFDEKGRDHYSIAVTGTKKIGDIDCYILKVTPKQATPKHYTGNMYISKKNLELISSEGGPAALETGVQSLYFSIMYKTMDSLPVIVKNHVEIYIHVPVFFPNRKMIIDNESKDHQLISN